MHVLAVDDERDPLQVIVRACSAVGIDCTATTSAKEALTRLRESGPGHFDAVFLDVLMPEVSGWECCPMLREVDPNLPVVFLSSLDDGNEADHGLTLGADDVIAKPISLGALIGRLKFLRERHERTRSIRHGRLRFDRVRHAVTADGKTIDVTPQEFRLLLELAAARGATLTRASLLENVWRVPSNLGTNRIEVHVANLRRKLKAVGIHGIHTVWGEGYALRVMEDGNPVTRTTPILKAEALSPDPFCLASPSSNGTHVCASSEMDLSAQADEVTLSSSA